MCFLNFRGCKGLAKWYVISYALRANVDEVLEVARVL